jgi:pycsar effector protein
VKNHWDIFRNINDFIRFSDTKAGVVLAFAGGAGVFLAGRVDIVHSIIVAHAHDALGWGLYAVFYGYLVSLLWTMVCAFLAIRPALGSAPKRSILYFKHISEDFAHDHKRYADFLAALDDPALEAELAHQICVNAGIATRKFDWVNRAMTALAITGGFWLLSVFLILVLGGPASGK